MVNVGLRYIPDMDAMGPRYDHHVSSLWVAHVLSVSVSAQAIQAENKRRQVRMDFRAKAGGGFQITWRVLNLP